MRAGEERENGISLGQLQTTSDISKSASSVAAPRAATRVSVHVPATICAGTFSNSRCHWARPGLLPVQPQNNNMFHINQFELIFQFSPRKKCWQEDVLPVERQNKKKPTQKSPTTSHRRMVELRSERFVSYLCEHTLGTLCFNSSTSNYQHHFPQKKTQPTSQQPKPTNLQKNH